jgi:NOL1/NOP2/fmu family ribosome biogenesis protein
MRCIEIREERAYLLPGELPSIRGLRFLRTGLYLGDCKKNRFEPSQALAMWLSMEDYPDHLSFSSEDERVLRYLKGESIFLSEKEAAGRKGWILVGVDGYPLGWGKIAGETLKNKYYPGWRLQ